MLDTANVVALDATIIEKSELRYTPAGIAVFEAVMHYQGEVYEAGAQRKLEFDIKVLAFADTALRINEVKVGQFVNTRGFIAPRSMRNNRLTMHITEFNI